jgi:serine protease AprX
LIFSAPNLVAESKKEQSLIKNIRYLKFAALAYSQTSHPKRKFSSEFDGLDPQSKVKVIVQWKNQVDNTKEFKVTRRGGAVFSRLRSVKAGVYNLSSAAVKDLANDPEVAHISIDHWLRANLDNTAGAINASAAWTSGFNGANIGVALIDSGINGDPDLGLLAGVGTRIVYVEDFTHPNSSPLTSLTGNSLLGAPTRPNQYGQDLYGHGQHLAGIIGGNGSSSNCINCTRQFIGAAPGANLLDLRVLDQNGEGSDSVVIAAIDRAIQLKDSYNVRVINLSLGRPVYESYTEDPLCQAVEAAWKAGIVVVVSAGNEGRDNSYQLAINEQQE